MPHGGSRGRIHITSTTIHIVNHYGGRASGRSHGGVGVLR
jgi:hypothetical protein